jgi:hypothetical protein
MTKIRHGRVKFAPTRLRKKMMQKKRILRQLKGGEEGVNIHWANTCQTSITKLISSLADDKQIVFYNTGENQCSTHFDRDSSILYLLLGTKEVIIACPRSASFGTGVLGES